MKKVFSLQSWFALSEDINSDQDWLDMIEGKKEPGCHLPRPALETVPSKIVRRLDNLGRCVLSLAEQCLTEELKAKQPAVITVSRHGNLPFMTQLIETIRKEEDVSPTLFAYSVHNRFSSLISMFAGLKGVNGAYSSPYDGFPIAMAEALSLIEEDPERPVILVAYEPEIPESYGESIKHSFFPHAALFVLQSPNLGGPVFAMDNEVISDEKNGGFLPLLNTILTQRTTNDGCWAYSSCQ